MRPKPIGPVPEDTVRVAKAAFPKGNVYMEMRDVLGSIYEDEDFSELFEVRGRPAIAPWRLALVTVMQFSEGLSDRQAAEAVRARIDWKFALGLQLTDPGFDFSVLSEFHSRLVKGGREGPLLEKLLEGCKERGYLKARGRQRADSTHVLGALRVLSQLEQTAETMRAALNAHRMPESVVVHASQASPTHPYPAAKRRARGHPVCQKAPEDRGVRLPVLPAGRRRRDGLTRSKSLRVAPSSLLRPEEDSSSGAGHCDGN